MSQRKTNLIDDDMTSFDVNLAEAAQEMEEKDVYSQTPAYESATDLALPAQPPTL